MAKAYRAALSALVIGSALAGTVGAARAETLADAIALAYQTNPTLQAQRAQVRFQDEQYVQARALYRPTVAGTMQALYEMQWINPCTGNPFTGTGCQDSSPEGNQLSANVTMTQPLYTSGKATATIHQAQADILTQRETLRTTENQVLADTITAYVDVRRDQQALAIHLDDVNAMKQQVADARARFEVGEVTKTDVAQAETYLAQSQAAFSVAQAQLALSRASYAQTVGQSPGELAPEPELTLLPKTIDQAFETATQNAPSIRSAGYAVQSAEAQIAEAKASLGPTVSLQAVYNQATGYKPLIVQNYTRRVDVAIVLTQPLYAGGSHESQVRQAVERQNFYRIQEETARRTVVQNLSQAWNRMLAARASIAAGIEQVRAARLAYEGATEEEKAGLRTTFEVLQQEQILASAEISLNSARHDAYAATAQVLQVAGLLEARLLVPDIAVQPGGHDFHRLKNVTGYVPWEEAIKRIDQIGEKSIHEAPPPLNAPIDAPIPTAAPADAPSGGK